MTEMTASSSTRVGYAALALASLVLMIPVLIAPIPPISDYPNHLARMWILAGGPGPESVSRFYQIHFDTFTNIAIDLVALTLGRLTTYEVCGRVCIGLAILLPAVGGAMLWRSIHGRFHWWMLSFGLLSWGQNLLDAFLNFQISIGLALIFAALEHWLRARPAGLRVGLRTMFSLVLLLAHPFGLLFYALLVAALAIGPRLALDGPAHRRRVLTELVLVMVSIGSVVMLFVLFVPALPGAQEHSGLSTLGAEVSKGFELFSKDPAGKLLNAFFAVRTYSNRQDLLTVLILATPVLLAAATRRLAVHQGLLLLSAGELAVYLACPDYLFGANWVDTRFAVMLAYTLAAATAPLLPGTFGRLAGLAMLFAFCGRTAMIGAVWFERQADVASVMTALEAVPEGSSVLPLEHRPADRSAAPQGRYTVVGENSFRHLPAIAVPLRHAFVPILFAARGKQPIQVRSPWNEIAEPNGGQLADIHALDPVNPRGNERSLAPYVDAWRRRFNYALVVNADMPDRFGPLTQLPGLSLVRDAGFARLYKIEPLPP